MKRFSRLSAVLLAFGASTTLLSTPAAAADAGMEVGVTLSGSRASMLRQNSIAKQESYSFLRTPTQVLRFVDDGHLVQLGGNADYAVIAGYPYARPVVRSFIERLSADYRAACGEQLVVTSLTRPSARQPRNASPLSVHPTGMAVDLRVSARAACRDWLSAELLTMEQNGLLDATREFRPPHFHIAVFPSPFSAYDQTLTALATIEEATRRIEQAAAEQLAAERLAEEAAADAAAELAAAGPLTPPMVLRVAVFMVKLVLPLSV